MRWRKILFSLGTTVTMSNSMSDRRTRGRERFALMQKKKKKRKKKVQFALWSISVLSSAAHQMFRAIRPINETSCHKIDLSRK